MAQPRCIAWPGPHSGRPAARWACGRETQRARLRAVAPVALASPPSRPSGEPATGPQRLEPRPAASTALRAAASEPSAALPAVDGGACVGVTT